MVIMNENERSETREVEREWEGLDGTIGLDWLGRVLLGWWRGLGRIPAG